MIPLRPTRRAAAVSALLVAAGWFFAVSPASPQTPDEERFKKLDAGPKTIDVSKYPADQQQAYKLFQTKCSSCHAVARGINTDMVLPGDWERYVRRMMHKPNSGINDAEGKTLYRFMVYDAAARKPELLRKALATLPPEEKAAAVEKIKAVNPSFAP
jgi:hypothetical protein